MHVFFVTRGLPFILELGLLVFCLIDIVQTPPEDCRNLGKMWWILLVVVLPLVGGIAWLAAGRPQRALTGVSPDRGRRRVVAPDDDPEFLAQLSKVDAEQERTLSAWQDDLKRREEELRRRQAAPENPPPSKPDDFPRKDGDDGEACGSGWVERQN